MRCLTANHHCPALFCWTKSLINNVSNYWILKFECCLPVVNLLLMPACKLLPSLLMTTCVVAFGLQCTNVSSLAEIVKLFVLTISVACFTSHQDFPPAPLHYRTSITLYSRFNQMNFISLSTSSSCNHGSNDNNSTSSHFIRLILKF